MAVGLKVQKMTKIKLCGMTRPCDIETVNALKPDYIGFIFAKKSKRYVTPETAAGLKEKLDKDIKSVGVFVNEDQDIVAGLLEKGVIDLAQLHGDEDDAYIESLKARTGNEVIKALKIRQKEDLKAAHESSADFILLDAGAGDGKAFDWELLKDFDRPYFLAGGLDPYNVGDAIRWLHPFGVDVSSGIESDGVKDPGLMKKFVDEVRREN